MATIVALFGFLFAVLGTLGVFSPARLVGLVAGWQPRPRLYAAVVFRVVFGVLAILAAPACRLTWLVWAIGIMAVIGAVILLMMGAERFDALVGWWLGRPAWLNRLWSGLALVLGLFLVYAGI